MSSASFTIRSTSTFTVGISSITSHRVAITVEQLEIMSAMMDDRWDMLRRCIVDEHGQPISSLSVAELLEGSVYDTEMQIHGEVALLGELIVL